MNQQVIFYVISRQRVKHKLEESDYDKKISIYTI
jgi:hypothetical protein